MKRDILDRLNAARQKKRPAVLATAIGPNGNGASGRQWLFVSDDEGQGFEVNGGDLGDQARAALKEDRPRTLETDGGEIFLNPFNPPLRMVIVGAVHISQALAPMAALAGFNVSVIDPRGAFAEAERFAGIAVSPDWPDDALRADPPDSRTAIITLTHDPKLDDAALGVALGSEAFYIGSLGSRKTHSGRLKRLEKAGFDASALTRIDGPVGLDIGARTPSEIAVAILAKVVETLRTRQS